jgi:hypothetical protein
VKPSGMKGIGEKQEKEGADLMYEMRDDFSKQLEADPLTEPKDQGGRMTKAFAKGMWLTFDVGIVPERAIGEDVYAWLIRMTPPIAQHVLSCFAAYPEIESKQKSIQSAFLRNHVAKALPGLSAAKVKDSLVENVEEATGIGF